MLHPGRLMIATPIHLTSEITAPMGCSACPLPRFQDSNHVLSSLKYCSSCHSHTVNTTTINSGTHTIALLQQFSIRPTLLPTGQLAMSADTSGYHTSVLASSGQMTRICQKSYHTHNSATRQIII